jgi:hypothetical protein
LEQHAAAGLYNLQQHKQYAMFWAARLLEGTCKQQQHCKQYSSSSSYDRLGAASLHNCSSRSSSSTRPKGVLLFVGTASGTTPSDAAAAAAGAEAPIQV